MSSFPRGGHGDGNGNGYSASRAAMGSSASPAGKLRTPTEVMRDRKAREEARRQRDEQTSDAPSMSQYNNPRTTAKRRAESAGVAQQQQQQQQPQQQQARDSGYRSALPTASAGATPAEQAYNTPTLQGPAPTPRRGGYEARQTVQSPYETGDVPMQQPQAPRTRQASQPEAVPPRISSAQPRQPTTSSAQQRQSTQSPQPRTSAQTTSTRGASAQTNTGAEGAPQRSSNVSTFPHAFERWETLSSRWEGLTSYWLRKLETNPPKADINQEMARQITDLAAAGANLFHAVVELQRLRASSERKFQRWFYETRAQQEQAQEEQVRLRQMYDKERAAREEDRQAREEEVREQQSMRNHERLLQEYKRELQIAKDEAKRAWEELGRREQAERERIFSLREGHTIDIGGVQVVPHGAPSRGGSQRETQPDPTRVTQAPQHPGRTTTELGSQEYPPPSPTDTDPFSSGARVAPHVPRAPAVSSYSQASPRPSAMQPAGPMPAAPAVPLQSSSRNAGQPSVESPSARFYSQQQGTSLHGQTASGSSAQAYAGSDPGSDLYDYELEDTGHIRNDAAGNPIIRYRHGASAATTGTGIMPGPAPTSSQHRPPSVVSDDLEVEQAARERIRTEQYSRSQPGQVLPQVHSAPQPHSAELEESPTQEYAADQYDGRDWPEDELDWGEQQDQRHHHPSRLSAVPEEDDDRSRMSRPSRGSDGMF